MQHDEALRLEVELGDTRRVVHHRGTVADLGVLRQSFNGAQPRELKPRIFARRVARRAEAIRAAGGKPFILDLGANIGATALRFGALFPDTHIVAVEPHPGNVALLRRNLEGLDADIRAAAIGRVSGETRIVNPEASEWAFRTGGSESGPTVPVLTIAELVREKTGQGMAPLILKCDVEGAEAELFGEDSDWFDDFAMVSVEPHDWMLPDEMTANGFLRAHLRTPRSLLLQGENLVSVAMSAPYKSRAR